MKRSKLDPRAKKGVFFGFSHEVKGYSLWCPESKKVIVCRDVTFNEFEMLKQLKPEDSSEHNKAIGTQQVEFNAPVDSEERIEKGAIEEEPVTTISQQSESIATRKLNRETR